MSNLGNKETMAKNLSHYVQRSGKTQKELSEVVGVATSTFNDWMKARRYPRIDKIEMLARYFGITKADLIEEKPATLDGFSENKQALIDFARLVPEDKAAMVLRILKSIVEDET